MDAFWHEGKYARGTSEVMEGMGIETSGFVQLGEEFGLQYRSKQKTKVAALRAQGEFAAESLGGGDTSIVAPSSMLERGVEMVAPS